MTDPRPQPHEVYDLHTHSRVSDGSYTPEELVARAATVGIHELSLTDHDTTAGLAEASIAAQQQGIRLIPGVEISLTWQGKTIHVVGLNIDVGHPALQDGLLTLQAKRFERAREMGRRLAKAGINGVYEEAAALAGAGMITRTHFAHCLVRRGLAADVRDVFNRYLVSGKPGYVSTQWADPAAAIGWITGAGGIAVLAHPQRYKLTASWLRRLLGEFKDMGGEAMEVLSGACPPGDVQSSAALARQFQLRASCGSDFHGPDEGWPKLGRLPPLPAGLEPVWEAWENNGDSKEEVAP